jgi:tetratricopeptide (TPR) repeat protein
MNASSAKTKGSFALVVFIVACTVAYLPGLSGDFIYDDWGSIAGNANIQIKDGTLGEWWRAALLFPSGTPPFRSLTMLTFAANYYISGLDPFGFKLTNLCIHLLNGILLFIALRALFALRRACSGKSGGDIGFNENLAAASIAGLWLLLPINLSAVLYSVQRLEALAATFIFLGLAWYLRARLRVWEGRGGSISLWLSIGVCTALGLLAKETAVMLPFYAALAEFCIARGRTREGRWSRPVLWLYGLTLLLPLVVGTIWMWGRYIGPGKLGTSSFAFLRLITESRVWIDYIAWTLAPSLDALTLYHDDIPFSHGLLDPPTTLTSIVWLLALLGVALWQRKRRPLFALGILWFFAGHLLTGTVIPLILAFEHRNYFSSAGLLLACASLIALEGPLVRGQLRVAAVAIAALFYAGTTWMRANEWSDGLHLAMNDAMKRPNSSAAQFDYAQALLKVSMETKTSEPAEAALKVLDKARRLPGAGIHFEQSMITLLGESGYPAPDEVWNSLIDKLKRNPPDTNAIHALTRLNHCFQSKQCNAEQLPQLAATYEAAFSHGRPSEGLLAVHAEYAWHLANDRDRAEQDFREALKHHPDDIAAQMNLAVVLIYQGKLDEAEKMIEAMERRNYLGSLDSFIDPLKTTLDKVTGTGAPVPEAQ